MAIRATGQPISIPNTSNAHSSLPEKGILSGGIFCEQGSSVSWVHPAHPSVHANTLHTCFNYHCQAMSGHPVGLSHG